MKNEGPEHRDEDETWAEDDPDFVLALSMYLDQVEDQSSNAGYASAPSDKADYISISGCVRG